MQAIGKMIRSKEKELTYSQMVNSLHESFTRVTALRGSIII